MDNPTQAHFQAATKVLKYFKGCPGKGLFFSRNSDIQLLVFSDANWAKCVDSWRSITGYCFFIRNSLVSWNTKKRNIVSRSSSEAKYQALASATCELQWLTYLLNDLCITCFKQAILYCDNQSALYIAYNSSFQWTNEAQIDYHLVREKSQAGLMRLLPVSSSNQVADIFTKALPLWLFFANLSKLELVDIMYSSLQLVGGYYMKSLIWPNHWTHQQLTLVSQK